ncbi:Sulfur carrier protein adenylyltransferase [uncultured Gammaproteobacteria bacterium]
MAGGYRRWQEHGLPVELPRVYSPAERERYSRHFLIPEVGEAGQTRLLNSRVLVVGAGGLGSPVAFYLAAAGVGTLGLVDDDVVDRSNLQRQILHTEDRVGTSKVASAKATLLALNPSLRINEHPLRLDSGNGEAVLSGYDLVVDGTDNFAARYLINDVCVRLGLPLVYGAILRFEGQISVFWPRYPGRRGPCYRCLFPEPPPAGLVPSCSEAGVLGVLPGVIGTLMATEAIKLLLGLDNPLVGRLVLYDALKAEFREFKVKPDPACHWCGDHAEPQPYIDYGRTCAAPVEH